MRRRDNFASGKVSLTVSGRERIYREELLPLQPKRFGRYCPGLRLDQSKVSILAFVQNAQTRSVSASRNTTN